VLNGHLLWLARRTKRRLRLVTLMPQGWLIPAGELVDQNPRSLMEQLRSVFQRAKIGQDGGWAYFVLDVEYIEHLVAFAFHAHGIATKRVALRVRELRNRRKFKWPAGSDGIPNRPVQVKLVTRGDEARVINYLLKSYFGMRVYVLDEDGNLVRTRQRTAIPEPRQTDLIAWLSRWRIEDFVLPLNLYFGRDCLMVSRRRRR